MPIKTDWEAGEILTAAQVSTYLANAGLDFIKEVYVGDSSVTQVQVTGAFSDTNYVNFKIVYQNIDPSGTGSYFITQLLDGTTATTTDYKWSSTYTLHGETTVNTTSGSSVSGWYTFSNESGYRYGSFDIYAPNNGDYPTMVGNAIDRLYYRRVHGSYTSIGSFDGFQIVAATSGSMQGGSFIVYGYRMT